MNTTTRDVSAPVPADVQTALMRLVTYMWNDEAADFVGAPAVERCSHIFADLVRVRAWLEVSGIRSTSKLVIPRGEGWSL